MKQVKQVKGVAEDSSEERKKIIQIFFPTKKLYSEKSLVWKLMVPFFWKTLTIKMAFAIIFHSLINLINSL